MKAGLLKSIELLIAEKFTGNVSTIDFNNPPEKAIHNKLVSLVDRMLELHKKKNSIPPSAEREKIEREIAVTDEKIDEIVYGLYGIREDNRRWMILVGVSGKIRT